MVTQVDAQVSALIRILSDPQFHPKLHNYAEGKEDCEKLAKADLHGKAVENTGSFRFFVMNELPTLKAKL